MKQRLISAFFGVILLFAVMLANRFVFDIAVVIISSMAIYEVISALNLNEHKTMTVISLLMPLVVGITSVLEKEYIFSVAFFFIGLYLLTMLFSRKRYSFNDVAKFATISLMITLSFVHLTFVRQMNNGVICVFVIFIGSWITDSFAYFTGLAFGKHKLAPCVSPKKTIEGAIGGIVGVTVVITAYTVICANIMNMSANIIIAVVTGILCGVLSQLGDLCASVIKRENNVKDFGHIMPGHGGVMDRFDSFLFVSPLVYYILEFFPLFS